MFSISRAAFGRGVARLGTFGVGLALISAASPFAEDPTVEFSVTRLSGEEAGGALVTTLVLSSVSSSDVIVPFSMNGDLTLSDDFSLDVASPILIPAGDLSLSMTFTPVDDFIDEDDESVTVTLGPPSGANLGAAAECVLSLLDNDEPPSVEFSAASQEGSEGGGDLTVDVVLSSPSGLEIIIPLQVTGSCVASEDFTLSDNPVVIPAGQASFSLAISPIDDGHDEPAEMVSLAMEMPTHATLGVTTVHEATLTDDDRPPTVAFVIPSQEVLESGQVVPVTVQLSSFSGLAVSVPFTCMGDAQEGSDYQISHSPLVIPPGQTSLDILVTLLDDSVDEGRERIRIAMDVPGIVNADPGGVVKHRLTIVDDDGPGFERGIKGLQTDLGSLDFPLLEVGQSDGPHTVVLTNTQDLPIAFKGVVIDGPFPSDFHIGYGQAMPANLQPGDSATMEVTFQPNNYGARDGVARIVQVPAGTPAAEVLLRGLALGLPGDELRMTMGPDCQLDSELNYWAYDFGVIGDSAYLTTEHAIEGTEDDLLFQVSRVGGSFGLSVEVPDGEYEVTFHFAEIEDVALGERVFDIFLEGDRVVQGLDLLGAAGWATAWNTGPIRTSVTDGLLHVGLLGVAGEALLSALEVRSVPDVTLAPTELDFGIIDQGATATAQLVLTNSGLAGGQVSKLGIVLNGSSEGTTEGVSVRLGTSEYFGGVSTVYYSVDLALPPGEVTPIEVTFTPTEHSTSVFSVELSGDFGALSAAVTGTGGADADWGFLHPVIGQSPTLLVDYDQNGTEVATLFGGESHTHEPGQSISTFQWEAGGVAFSDQVDPELVIGLGPTSVELTVTDDKPNPDDATESRELDLHTPDRIPGVMASYYDGQGDPVHLLDNVPGLVDYMERIEALSDDGLGGTVGGSPFSGDVMVSWRHDFDVVTAAAHDFQAHGGAESRVLVDGQAWSGPAELPPGMHSLEVRFAVQSLAELPLRVDVYIDGVNQGGWSAGAFHDARFVVPVLHSIPAVGSELGGNLIVMKGFGFFPKDRVAVRWGKLIYKLDDLEGWADDQISLISPPGTGSIQVRVQTPNGISNALEFVYSPDGPVPIKFIRRDDRAVPVTSATTACFHPNGSLYVGTLDGKIHALTYDEDWVAITSAHEGVSGLTNNNVLGIAINPYDPPDPVKLYVAHGQHFLNGGGSFSGESPFTGQISVLTGPGFDQPVPLVTGLPTSNHDHGVNGILFDNNGDLLICAGGNTNAGVRWPLLGDLPGSPLSGAVLKANTSKPDFNGQVRYISRVDGASVDDQVEGDTIDLDGLADVEVYSSGFRNSLDITLTTRGLLYGTDNGPNSNYGPASTGPDTDSGVHPNRGDELNLVRRGGYYGHPNRNRGYYDQGQNVWRDVSEGSGADYSGPLHMLPSSSCGLAEYRAKTFNSQMRGWLLAQKWNGHQRGISLSSDGQDFVSELVINPVNRGLDVITAPGGAIVGIDYSAGMVRVLEPDDISAVGVVAHDIHPWRTTASAGTPFVIGGEGFVTGQTSVEVGGISCPVTAVTPRRIHGVFPDLPQNNIGDLHDVMVRVGLTQVALPAAVLVLPVDPGQMKGFWVPGASLPNPLGEVACGVVGDRMFLFGEGTSKTYEYDLLGNGWGDGRAPRPYPGNHHACEVVDGKLYLIGGLGGGSAGRVQIYDPNLDSWSMGEDMPWAGGSCSSGVVDGLIYACGGIVGNTTVSNLSVYDPAKDEWDKGGGLDLTGMTTKVNHAASASDGQRFWVFGGRQGGNWPQAGFDTVQVYDPLTDTWDCSDLVQSDLGPMPLGRGGTGRAVFYEGEFYVFGGEDASDAFDEVQVYRPGTNSWRSEAPMPTARHGHFPVLFQGRFFLGGGGVVAGFSASDVLEIFQRP